MRTEDIVLIAGIPGAGKSTFCGWLKQEKGFIHLEFDKLLVGAGQSDELSLIAVLKSRGVEAFIAELRKLRKNVAIEWGFHPDNLPQVQEMAASGIDLWWFDGDRSAARAAFKLAKGETYLPAFDQQLDRIVGAWGRISAVFTSKMLAVVHSGPSHTPCEETWRKISPEIGGVFRRRRAP
jgi:hypothetical protein